MYCQMRLSRPDTCLGFPTHWWSCIRGLSLDIPFLEDYYPLIMNVVEVMKLRVAGTVLATSLLTLTSGEMLPEKSQKGEFQ